MAEYTSPEHGQETTVFTLTPEKNKHHSYHSVHSKTYSLSALTLQDHLQNTASCLCGSTSCLVPALRLLDHITAREGEVGLAQARIIHSRHMCNGGKQVQTIEAAVSKLWGSLLIS